MTDKPAGDLPPATPANGEMPEAAKTEIEPTAAELVAERESLKKALRDANRESADRRKKLEAYETAEAERKQAEMTEVQKLQAKLEKAEAERTQAQAQANERVIMAELRAQAASMGFTDLDYAVFKVRGKVTLNDDGQVEGAEEALKELAKASPVLVKKPSAPLNPGNPGAAQTGETPAQQRARIYGDGGGIFDRATSDSLGGGVFMNTDPNKQP